MSGYGTTTVCPNCDSTFIRHRPRQDDGEWRCEDCKSTFDDYDTRERRSHGHTEGLAAELEQMDPDELGGFA